MSTTTDKALTAEQNLLLILLMTGLSRDHLSEVIYLRGLQYLKQTLRSNEENIAIMSESKLFWLWWKKQWEKRDSIFIHEFHLEDYKTIADRETAEYFLTEYQAAHSLVKMNIHPNRYVMRSAVANFVRREKDTASHFNTSN
jgi:hypothetical protein